MLWSKIESGSQIKFIGPDCAVKFGLGSTFTVINVVVLMHPVFPITVYVVLIVGLATTVPPEVALNPFDGNQEYVFAPTPDNKVDAPEHMV